MIASKLSPRQTLSEDLKSIDITVLLLHGELDQVVPIKAAALEIVNSAILRSTCWSSITFLISGCTSSPLLKRASSTRLLASCAVRGVEAGATSGNGAAPFGAFSFWHIQGRSIKKSVAGWPATARVAPTFRSACRAKALRSSRRGSGEGSLRGWRIHEHHCMHQPRSFHSSRGFPRVSQVGQ